MRKLGRPEASFQEALREAVGPDGGDPMIRFPDQYGTVSWRVLPIAE